MKRACIKFSSRGYGFYTVRRVIAKPRRNSWAEACFAALAVIVLALTILNFAG